MICAYKLPECLAINVIHDERIKRLSSKRNVLASNPTLDTNFYFVILASTPCAKFDSANTNEINRDIH